MQHLHVLSTKSLLMPIGLTVTFVCLHLPVARGSGPSPTCLIPHVVFYCFSLGPAQLRRSTLTHFLRPLSLCGGGVGGPVPQEGLAGCKF